ncbi:MAG: GNAT family N-acetyltransferase [Actinomycetota bacterium]|nr:GNAT family N-acetyltransferase [Actinomycetota bacterium]
MTTGPRIEVRTTAPDELAEPLSLLEKSLRNGDSVPPPLAERLARAVERGDLEVLTAWSEGRIVGVAVVSLRPNVSLGAIFASIEDFYVTPEVRRRGVGRALLGAVEDLCRARSVSYVEVQTDEEAAPFYEASGYETEADVRVLSQSYVL